MKTALFLLMTTMTMWSAEPKQQARVFIYQTNRALRSSPVFVDGMEVASLRHRWTYFVVQLPAGEHSLRGRHQGNELVVDLVPGQDYYFRLDQANSFTEKFTREATVAGRAMVSSGKMHSIDPDDVRDQTRVVLTVAK